MRSEECVVAGLPDADEIRHLDVAASRPVLRLSRKAFMGGRPIEYAEAELPADRYQLWFPLTRGCPSGVRFGVRTWPR